MGYKKWKCTSLILSSVVKDKVYILSTGRSGSTFISHLFNQLNNDIEVDHQKKGSRLINIITNLPFYTTKLLWFLFKVFNRRDSKGPQSTSDPLLSFAIYRFIIKGYLNGKVIHLVRNPESFADSFMRWKNQSLRKKVLHHLVPFWNPSPLVSDAGISLKQWLKMDKYEQFAWVWKYKNEKYYSLKNILGNDYLLVRMEDLTNADDKIRKNELSRIVHFLGLNWDEEQLKKIDNRKINRSQQKMETKNMIVNKHEKLKYYCKDLAEKLGYKL